MLTHTSGFFASSVVSMEGFFASTFFALGFFALGFFASGVVSLG